MGHKTFSESLVGNDKNNKSVKTGYSCPQMRQQPTLVIRKSLCSVIAAWSLSLLPAPKRTSVKCKLLCSFVLSFFCSLWVWSELEEKLRAVKRSSNHSQLHPQHSAVSVFGAKPGRCIICYSAFSDVMAWDPVPADTICWLSLTDIHNLTFEETGGGRKAAPNHCWGCCSGVHEAISASSLWEMLIFFSAFL